MAAYNIAVDCFPERPVVRRIGEKDSTPLLFQYGGKTYATNLFRLHDQEGFSLTDSLIECRKRGWVACTQQFVFDAIKAGWEKDRAERILQSSTADAASMGVL